MKNSGSKKFTRAILIGIAIFLTCSPKRARGLFDVHHIEFAIDGNPSTALPMSTGASSSFP